MMIEESKEKSSINIGSIPLNELTLGLMLASVVVGLVVGIAIAPIVTGPTVTKEFVGNKTMEYVNSILSSQGATAELVDISDSGANLYQINFTIKAGGQRVPSSVFATKDGKLILLGSGGGIRDLTEPTPILTPTLTSTPTSTPSSILKTEKPTAHAFVMSYCPYGLQFVKAYVPVVELLGDKADIELNFVDYAMHGKKELDENTRMYCIQKEQNEKLTSYLRCFVENDDPEKCIADAAVDDAQLESCISAADSEFSITELYNDKDIWVGSTCPNPPYCFPQYLVDATLANQYNVGGSPTFILNGDEIRVERSAEAVKQAICSAFNNPPAECGQTLSTTVEQPGIGPMGSGSGAGSEGQC